MPISIISPKHSFINFNGNLSSVVLPAYNGVDVAFQFMFAPESAVPLSAVYESGLAYEDGTDISASYQVQNICAWGRFEGIDFLKDFPLTVTGFPLAGQYTTPKEFLLAVKTVYNIDATGQNFLQCCSLESLPNINFTFNGKAGRIRFYKGLQWVKIEGGFSQLPIATGQCFKYVIRSGSERVLSNTFQRVDSDRFLTRVRYSSNEDSYGFYYRPAITNVNKIPATPPDSGEQALVAGVRAWSWNSNGARIYDSNFPLNGLGTVVAHLTVPHLWVNGDQAVEVVNGSTTGNDNDGRMNANGIWVQGNTAPNSIWLPVDEWIGFSRKISLPQGKTFYLGVSGDNLVKIKINGKEIINTSGSDVFNPSSGINFLTWSIYPVSLPAGDNYIEMSVMNTSVNLTSNPAGFACEIYDMTAEELQNARSGADLKIVFRTRDMIGQRFDLGTSVGYSCADGWILAKEGDNYFCVKNEEGDLSYNELYLPILSKAPKYPERRKVYIKSNNQYKVQSAVIEKEWECKTEDLPDEMHEKLAVMLAHDNIRFSNYFINDFVTKTSDAYAPNWPDDDFSVSCIATFKVNTPFAGRNSNCEKRRVCATVTSPVECVPLSLNTAYTLPNGQVGVPYIASQPIFGGTAPYTLAVTVKPDWMEVSLQNGFINYTGTPTSASNNLFVQVSVSNCGGAVPYNAAFNITDPNAANNSPTYVSGVAFVDDSPSFIENRIYVVGVPGATVTFTLTTYDNPNGGTLKVNGSQVLLGNTVNVMLDDTGHGSLVARIDGITTNVNTIIRGAFTMTHVSQGAIDPSLNTTFQISKVF